MMIFISAIILGFGGSLHCIGMCGPIVLSLPQVGGTNGYRLSTKMSYNAGRIATYSMLGALIGLLGQGIDFMGYQQMISLALGVFILTMVILSYLLQKDLLKIPFLNRLWYKLSPQIQQALAKQPVEAMFKLGLINGLLPCGLVYLGLMNAVLAGGVWSGALSMAAFGLGTLPVMMLTIMGASRIRKVLGRRSQLVMKSMTLFFAIFLILRGLGIHPLAHHSPNSSSENITYCQ